MTPEDEALDNALPEDLDECYVRGRTWAQLVAYRPPSKQIAALFNGVRDAVRDRETLAKIDVHVALRTLVIWFIVGLLLGAGLVLLGEHIP